MRLFVAGRPSIHWRKSAHASTNDGPFAISPQRFRAPPPPHSPFSQDCWIDAHSSRRDCPPEIGRRRARQSCAQYADPHSLATPAPHNNSRSPHEGAQSGPVMGDVHSIGLQVTKHSHYSLGRIYIRGSCLEGCNGHLPSGDRGPRATRFPLSSVNVLVLAIEPVLPALAYPWQHIIVKACSAIIPQPLHNHSTIISQIAESQEICILWLAGQLAGWLDLAWVG